MKRNIHYTRRDIEGIRKVRQLLVQSPSAPHTLERLSAVAGINQYKLKYGFAFFYQQSIRQFLIAIRMQAARQLLQETDDPVKAIAKACGYTSKQSFIAAFKRENGMTPRAYRISNSHNP